MTFSIVARDAATGDLGVAVASRFLAVGSVVPAASAGIGAIATQALGNVRYKPDGLGLLAAGVPAAEVVARLVATDRLAHHRQLGVVDARGGSASHTGASCSDWAGGRTAPGLAVQGNILVGPAVVDAMVEAFLVSSGLLADRLLGALRAGDEAGGDRRGRQSAALYVVRERGGYLGGDDRLVDLRVDDHPDPVAELARIRRLHVLTWERPEAADLVALDAALAAELRALLEWVGATARTPEPEDPEVDALFDAGGRPGEPRPWPAGWDEGWQARLEGWMGLENVEGRLVAAGWIDPLVVELLRERGAG